MPERGHREQVESRAVWRLAVVVALVGIVGCQSATAPAAATLRFKVDAPFCGATPMFVRVSIDQAVRDTEQLSTGQTSKPYTVSPGQHELATAIVGIGLTPLNGRVTQDTTVVLRSGDALTYTVSVYCS